MKNHLLIATASVLVVLAPAAHAEVKCVDEGARVTVFAERGVWARAAARQAYILGTNLYRKHKMATQCNNHHRVEVNSILLNGFGFNELQAEMIENGYNGGQRINLVFTDNAIAPGLRGMANMGVRGELPATHALFAFVNQGDPYLVAHELAHTFGVEHVSDPEDVMHETVGWRMGPWYTFDLSPVLLLELATVP